MNIRLFYHSLVSDWNHGNAHFLRGVVSELMIAGHEVTIFEPANGWSRKNLIEQHGEAPLREFAEAFPGLSSVLYHPDHFDVAAAVGKADLVIIHEWSDPALVEALGRLRARHPFVLLFHDTHHRLISQSDAIRSCNLSHYDGVLAYGRVLRDMYLQQGLTKRAWTWHEAADIVRFHPIHGVKKIGDLVWIGNWGDGERSTELQEFLIEPVQRLGVLATVYGVRYPDAALASLKRAGIRYGGWLPNFRVPSVFAAYRATIHIPRRPYVRDLPGIPTIRPFEAMACGIPLISAPWDDVEGLFSPGHDYLEAATGAEMEIQLSRVLEDPVLAKNLAHHGLATILKRHTCAHRVAELLEICRQVRPPRLNRPKPGPPANKSVLPLT